MRHCIKILGFKVGSGRCQPLQGCILSNLCQIVLHLVNDAIEPYLSHSFDQICNLGELGTDIVYLEYLQISIRQQLESIGLIDCLEDTIECISLILIRNGSKMRMSTTIMTCLRNLFTGKSYTVIV